MSGVGGFESAIDAARHDRGESRRRRARASIAVSVGVAVIWAGYVTASGQWGRVADHWASPVTMAFGSFVAGSTPQGGGAVAFPVFTKVLQVDAEVARTFSLSIQAIGMGAAAAAIIITRRLVEWRAVMVTLPAALAGFIVGLVALGRPDDPFWPSRLPGPYVKVTFTLLVAAMAVVVYLGFRVHLLERLDAMPIAGPRIVVALVVTGLLGGLAASLVGSGADVLVYLAVVVLIGVSPRIGVPTSVVVMAAVSIAGIVVVGMVDGQLAIGLDDAGAVTTVGGDPVGAQPDGTVAFGAGPALEADRYDLFGLWLAAVPVVAFGAPLGSWAASKATDRQLVRFVVALAAAETLSTIVFLDGLVRAPDLALIAFAIVGGIVVIGGLGWLERNRRAVLGLPAVDLRRAFTRSRLDAGPHFRDQLAATNGEMREDGTDPSAVAEEGS